jgi:hypothetical protein
VLSEARCGANHPRTFGQGGGEGRKGNGDRQSYARISDQNSMSRQQQQARPATRESAASMLDGTLTSRTRTRPHVPKAASPRQPSIVYPRSGACPAPTHRSCKRHFTLGSIDVTHRAQHTVHHHLPCPGPSAVRRRPAAAAHSAAAGRTAAAAAAAASAAGSR